MHHVSEREALEFDDPDIFADIYRANRQSLLVYATSLLAGDFQAAEDVVDTAFMDIWRNAASYSKRGSQIGWLRSIVHNKAVDWLRKFGDAKADIHMANFENSEANSAPDVVGRLSEKESIAAALYKLSIQHRETIQLFYYDELSLSEIADAMDCPENTVKTRLHYARKALTGHYTEVTA